MKIKCEYCGSYIQDTEMQCPNCGAPNSKAVRSGIGVPKTIEELKAFCAAHNLPLERMRFFIGENCQDARAFGIYEDEGNFIVYKNKADGSRVVRYRGNDEAYAVNEIYQKLRSEIILRKRNAPASGKTHVTPAKAAKFSPLLLIVIIIIVAISLSLCSSSSPDEGYYHYNDAYYYFYNGSWYDYDDATGSWQPSYSTPDELNENYSDYQGHSGSFDASDFTDSEYYSATDEDDWSSDWDDDDFDYDFDSGWDSFDTDWGSDW
ncbi:MAG: hypothetical protein Q4C01_04250 [Clostridia bacterium]|nr:hypothetical protein [Clostridia bacterium]